MEEKPRRNLTSPSAATLTLLPLLEIIWFDRLESICHPVCIGGSVALLPDYKTMAILICCHLESNYPAIQGKNLYYFSLAIYELIAIIKFSITQPLK